MECVKIWHLYSQFQPVWTCRRRQVCKRKLYSIKNVWNGHLYNQFLDGGHGSRWARVISNGKIMRAVSMDTCNMKYCADHQRPLRTRVIWNGYRTPRFYLYTTRVRWHFLPPSTCIDGPHSDWSFSVSNGGIRAHVWWKLNGVPPARTKVTNQSLQNRKCQNGEWFEECLQRLRLIADSS